VTPVLTRGRFVSLEGGEGAGKSTQARLLAEALRGRGIEVLMTREPGGTPGAEAIRALLLDPPGEGWGAPAEALLFAAARADHVERAIRPALEAGQWVVCDRFVDSSRAYQGEAGELGDADVLALHQVGSGGLLPDLTLVIEAPAQAVAERLARRDGANADAIGGRSVEYHAAVAAAFAALADREPARLKRIDGGGDADTVHARVMQAIEALL
jgi:dTMP kinase